MSPPRLFAATLGLAAGLAAADPGHDLLVPYDNEGLRTVEVRYWSVTRRQRPELTWPELGVGYGFNSRWTSTLYMSWIGSSARATKPATLNWQNTFLLTQGEWPVDVALHLQRIQPQQPGENRALEFGLLLQGDIGRTQFNTNLIVERHLAVPPTPTALKLQWQLRHRSGPGLQFGLLGFDELGPLARLVAAQAAITPRRTCGLRRLVPERSAGCQVPGRLAAGQDLRPHRPHVQHAAGSGNLSPACAGRSAWHGARRTGRDFTPTA